jgi:urea carboxylase
VESPVAGNIWKLNVSEGDHVQKGDVVAVLESMKMEIEIYAPGSGNVITVSRQEGQQINAGQAIMVLD